jgi:2-polyprenyl-3-methyl-5-hydroxy-6-metoxy-1,4-benzoquinol methylase
VDLKETMIPDIDLSTHWYYNAKAKAMMRFLEKTNPLMILDVGAGSGFFSHYLLANSTAEEAWCIDTSYLTEYDSHEGEKPIHFRRSIEFLEADLVLLMDVLEHVDDDIGLLENYAEKVPKGKKFLISVPAFQFLWSGHDNYLNHKRRYTLNQLENIVRKSGLKVRHSAYYFGVVFPIAMIMRLANKSQRNDRMNSRSQLSQHHPIVNNFLKGLCYAELPFMMLNRIAGLTVFCLAENI